MSMVKVEEEKMEMVFIRGFRRGKSRYVITCYHYGAEGHNNFECIEKKTSRRRSEARA
jgi:hypothetical protein